MQKNTKQTFTGGELHNKMIEAVKKLSDHDEYIAFFIDRTNFIQIFYDPDDSLSKHYTLNIPQTKFMKKYSEDIISFYQRYSIEWEKTKECYWGRQGYKEEHSIDAYFSTPNEIVDIAEQLFRNIFNVDNIRLVSQTTDVIEREVKNSTIFFTIFSFCGFIGVIGGLIWVLLFAVNDQTTIVGYIVLFGMFGILAFIFLFLLIVMLKTIFQK